MPVGTRGPRGQVLARCPDCSFVAIDLDHWRNPYDGGDYHSQHVVSETLGTDPYILDRVRGVHRHIRSGRVAELGCGLGDTAVALSRAGFDVVAVDESASAIAQLKSRFPRIEWVCKPIELFLQDAGTFDVITLYHVLEHVPRPIDLCRALFQSLRPEGLLVIEVPNVGGLSARLSRGQWQFYLDHHVNYFNPATLRRLLARAGFEVIRVDSKYHFSFPQGKPLRDIPHAILCFLGWRDIITTYSRRRSGDGD
jgi:2-polyprenyl-3-methyl-5-hydroxy-6-metoxy-1,4-benzoquinol methylase